MLKLTNVLEKVGLCLDWFKVVSIYIEIVTLYCNKFNSINM